MQVHAVASILRKWLSDFCLCSCFLLFAFIVFKKAWLSSLIVLLPSVRSHHSLGGMMPEIENGQHWLDRNRPPRVQITYDVEIGDAIEKKELPFVAGILSDLGGSDEKKGAVADRKFTEIDRDCFDSVMSGIEPTVTINLTDFESTRLEDSAFLKEDPCAKKFAATLAFREIEDFSPLAIVKQVPELYALYVQRERLRDMLAKLDGNVKLEEALDKTFQGTSNGGGE
jgi:type VI secretion system protein ImpB